MALTREQIEHHMHGKRQSCRWLKKQVNKYIRLKGKKIEEDEIGGKVGRKPLCGWEY